MALIVREISCFSEQLYMERDMSEVFNNQKLVEKLSKLNNSQQSIQTLSNWCIIHRKKAKNIVETWDIAFNNSPREKRVSFLYLANDILQNSRRVGNEFVNEFWKVLPGCLKNVYENGEDLGKKVVNRLVEIWDERKVFGSRGRGLKDEILGTVSAPVSNNGKSNSNPIKLIRKDSNSVRVKLALGEMPEKIVTAYQSVFDEYSSEDTALNKCTDAAQVLERMEKNIDIVTTQGDQQGLTFITDLQNQETVLKQCIEQLETAKSTRATLVYQLTEALKEQEFKLDLINDKLQISHSLSEHASSMRRRLDSAAGESGFEPTSSLPMSIPKLPPPHSVTSFAGSISSAEDDHKKAAAAVAAKLAASSSSAQVLSSILSSLAAEEAASLGNSLNSQVLSDGQAAFPLEKKPRLEKLISAPDIGMPSYFSQVQPQQHQSIPFTSQSNQAPPTFAPPLPPLPPLPPPPPLQQFAQTSGVTNIGPFPFAPPLSHASLGFTRPIIPPVPPPPQQRPAPQQQSSSMGFYQSPGVGFYGQSQTAPTAQPQ